MKVRRLLALALIVAASAGVVLLAEAMGGLTGLDQARYYTLGLRQTMTTESLQEGLGERGSDITIVFFDELAVEEWPWEQPFPRAHIASVVDAVASAGARTIGLDVYLERLYPRLNAMDGGDDLLRDALERAGNVVLVAPVQQTESGPSLRPPHPRFAEVAAAVGAADLPSAFETARDATLAVRSGTGLAPSFPLALYAHATGLDTDSLLVRTRRSGRVALAGLPATLGGVPDDWWEGGASANDYVVPFPIRFIGPPSSANAADPPGTFPAVGSSSAEFIAVVSPEFFRDRIVLIGSGFHDSDKFRTPFFGRAAPPAADGGSPRSYTYMYGVEVHANALQNLLDDEYVRPLAKGAELLLLLVMALTAGGVVFWRGAGWGGAATAAAILGLAVAALWLWAGQAFGPGGVYFRMESRFLWLPWVTPSLAGFVSYVGSVAYVSVVEGKEKRFIKSAFGKYVSPEVVAEIADHPDALQLGGQKRPLTLLFSDLAGFTTLSERMDPQDLLAHLNEYLQDMTQIVLDEKGTLDKYIGDAIMAFWNAPKEMPDHAHRALRTAVLMQRRMADLNAKWRAADPGAEELVVRIGVNTGTVVVGNVGGKDRFDYSAVGDAVNLAARLEPANKSYHTRVMASEFTLDAADRDAFRLREIDLIAVKGKVEPVKVYEILELAGVELPAHREAALARYQAGLDAYRRREWTAAAGRFRAALEADPDDGPSGVYLERATEYAASPPPADWDFVVRRTVK